MAKRRSGAKEGVEIVRERFGGQIDDARVRLCAKCRHVNNAENECSQGLLPLTTKGEDCLYYDIR